MESQSTTPGDEASSRMPLVSGAIFLVIILVLGMMCLTIALRGKPGVLASSPASVADLGVVVQPADTARNCRVVVSKPVYDTFFVTIQLLGQQGEDEGLAYVQSSYPLMKDALCHFQIHMVTVPEGSEGKWAPASGYHSIPLLLPGTRRETTKGVELFGP